MEKLNNAIQARSAAEAAQKSAASQYNNVDYPAEKASQQKLIDDAKDAHEAYVEADKAYKEAYANSLKSYTAMNDKSAYNNA